MISGQCTYENAYGIYFSDKNIMQPSILELCEPFVMDLVDNKYSMDIKKISGCDSFNTKSWLFFYFTILVICIIFFYQYGKLRGNKISYYTKKIMHNSRVEKSYVSKIKFYNDMSAYLRNTIKPFKILLALYSLYYFIYFVKI